MISARMTEIPTRKTVLGRWPPSRETTLWFSFHE